MDIRYAVHPEHMKILDTDNIRKQFLVERLFERDSVQMVYSHVDRIIAGGVCPAGEKLELSVTKELGVDWFLQRREMGIINVGAVSGSTEKSTLWKTGNASISGWGPGR
jgi:4-deoxy-L-threo-5-hexosulose-uronate ketol-isomerase